MLSLRLREGMNGSPLRLDTDVSCCSINHPEDSGAWEHMTAIKQDILRKWDSFPYPVQVCCIKFVQRVVQVQSHGLISDPRVCTVSGNTYGLLTVLAPRPK